MVILSSSPAALRDMTILGAVTGGLIVLVTASSQPAGMSMQERFGWMIRRRKRKTVVLVRRVELPPPAEPNGPPSVEKIRDLAQHGTTWVPHSGPSRRRSRP
jgi:hypothetical protein